MKRKTKKRAKTHYVCLMKASNEVIISTTKQHIADILGINVVTINRHLDSNGVYSTDEWCFWANIPMHYSDVGYALKPRYLH